MYFDLLVGRHMANGIFKELLEMVDIGCRKMGDRFIYLLIKCLTSLRAFPLKMLKAKNVIF